MYLFIVNKEKINKKACMLTVKNNSTADAVRLKENLQLGHGNCAILLSLLGNGGLLMISFSAKINKILFYFIVK